MIRIIKPGKIHTHTCEVCGCEFTYEDEDIKQKIYNISTKMYQKFVNCPCCDIKIAISNSR